MVKISLITVSYNAAATIEQCITSVIGQRFPHLQYIIIDGGSSDGTLEIVEKYKSHINYAVSEPDNGIYDAMNKGLAIAVGDVVGFLNADDQFTTHDVLERVADVFDDSNADILYADLDYIGSNNQLKRRWRSGKFKRSRLQLGWMPPHPTFYARRQLYLECGAFDLSFKNAADYELMLRFLKRKNHTVIYLQKVIVLMRDGGVSNSSLHNRIDAWKGDLNAMKINGIIFPYIAILLKPLRKISQYI